MDAKIIAERWEKATSYPWIIDKGIDAICEECGTIIYETAAIIRRQDNGAGICEILIDELANENAEAIANAPTDIRALLQANADQKAEIERLQERELKMRNCANCKHGSYDSDGLLCKSQKYQKCYENGYKYWVWEGETPND